MAVVLSACDGTIVAGDGDQAVDGGDAPGLPEFTPWRAQVVGTDGLGLRLREQPSTDADVVFVIPERCVVNVTGSPQGRWHPVVHDGKSGWSHGDFLEATNDAAGCPQPTGGNAFLLPWRAGDRFRVSQGHNTGSHDDNGAWAWDFAMPEGTAVLATHDGVVRRIKGDSTSGGCSSSYANSANYVVLERADGLESLYMHLKAVTVKAGAAIERGTTIGRSGQTGWSCGAHLHFQIQKGPGKGGTTSWWNPSVHQYFHDTGQPLDPAPGSSPVSANGS